MTLTSKFKKDIGILQAAVNKEIFFDVKNPKLYKKIRRYYQNEGIDFSGDPLDDYDMLMDRVYSELNKEELVKDYGNQKNS